MVELPTDHPFERPFSDLDVNPADASTVTYCQFNQDCSCLVVGT